MCQERRIYTTNINKDNRNASASAFVHSLNILVKYVRMYGFEHKRTEGQFEIAWNELQAAIPQAGDGGFLLGVSGSKLLLDARRSAHLRNCLPLRVWRAFIFPPK